MEKQRYIRVRSSFTDERKGRIRPHWKSVHVSEEQFRSYYREIRNYRERRQYAGECVCPRNAILDCDMDCYFCAYQVFPGRIVSLNQLISDGGDELGDIIEDTAPLPEEIVEGAELYAELLSAIEAMTPEKREMICKIADGISIRKMLQEDPTATFKSIRTRRRSALKALQEMMATWAD